MRSAALYVDAAIIKPRCTQQAVCDGIRRQFGPALAPQILRDIGAIHRIQNFRQFRCTLRHSAVNLPYPEHHVVVAARLLIAADVPGFIAIYADGANDATNQ